MALRWVGLRFSISVLEVGCDSGGYSTILCWWDEIEQLIYTIFVF